MAFSWRGGAGRRKTDAAPPSEGGRKGRAPARGRCRTAREAGAMPCASSWRWSCDGTRQRKGEGARLSRARGQPQTVVLVGRLSMDARAAGAPHDASGNGCCGSTRGCVRARACGLSWAIGLCGEEARGASALSWSPRRTAFWWREGGGGGGEASSPRLSSALSRARHIKSTHQNEQPTIHRRRAGASVHAHQPRTLTHRQHEEERATTTHTPLLPASPCRCLVARRRARAHPSARASTPRPSVTSTPARSP